MSIAEATTKVIAEDLVEVTADGTTVGFVQKVGRVFVALRGPDLGRAVEVGQSLSREQALLLARAL